MGKSVEIKELIFEYEDTRILDEITLNISQGNILTIIGPNGSGKSTLLKNISTTLKPGEGIILLDQKLLKHYKAKDLARELAVVPQNTNIEYDFTAHDIVSMGRNPYIERFKQESEADVAIIRESMERTNTWHLKDRPISQLSGGESQRVVIARALAQEPQVLLLDEPTAALDMHHQIEIMDLLKVLNRDKGVTIVMALHDINLAARYSKEILLLDKGKKIILGTPEEVITKENLRIAYKIDMIVDRNKHINSLQVTPLSSIER